MKRYYALMFSFVLVVWILCWVLIVMLVESPSERGQFGDMFGAVNALFSGLAFGGIIITVLLQSEELKIQRMELQLQRSEMVETRKEFVEQNKNLRIQRFESTFFNMVSMHHELVRELEAPGGMGGGRQVFMKVIDEWSRSLYQEEMISYNNTLLKKYKQSFNLYFDRAKFYYLSHYLQSLQSLYKLIKSSDVISEDGDKQYYFEILKSYISFPERRFLFYFVFLGETRDETIGVFKDMEVHLRILGAISSRELLDPSHANLWYDVGQ